MNFPQRQERREVRYPLHLPVLIRMAREEMHTRSENISLGGILLSSAFLIPEGSMVEVAVGVSHLPDPGILLNARGKVMRVQPTATGDYVVAIKLDRAFEMPVRRSEPQVVPAKMASPSPEKPKQSVVSSRVVHGSLAWQFET